MSTASMPNWRRLTLTAVTFAILFFLFFPIAVTILVSFNSSGFLLPPQGFTLDWYAQAWDMDEFKRGILVSFLLGVAAAAVANALAFPMALALVRYDFPGKAALNLFVMSPLLIPTTILGLALYVFLVRIGWGGGFVTLLVGHVMMVIPFAVRILTASLAIFDRSLEEAARNAGASAFRAFVSVSLPILKTGFIASMMICFIISWNDFAISIFLASPGWTPLPIQIYSHIQFQYDAISAAVVSSVILLSFLAIVAIDRIAGLRTVMTRRDRR
ncbi:ABC transporter permease [Devosia sp.]|uniref:ABC transporter permease n=1 Tax=Devosia sp. TaxID=1871048 RepID=UPI002F1EF739